MNFSKVKSYKDISKATASFAAKRGFEVLVGDVFEVRQDYWGNDYYHTTGYQVEIWYADDNAELFLVSYTIQNDGSLYFNTKTIDIHKELCKVEDLPLVIKDDKALRTVINYIAECLE